MRLASTVLLLLLTSQVEASDTTCADQAQQCAIVVEEFERQIQDVKSLAFRSCFSQNVCIQERVVFEDCYAKSVKAVRSPFNGNNVSNDEFFDAAERYRNQLEQCFHGSETANKPDVTSLLVDEDAIYGRAIYGNEYADRLWDLQEYGLEKPMLDPHDACLVKGPTVRVFGSGISHMVDSAGNNLNNSCTLETDELTCYRHFLDQDTQFRQILKNRDRALRSCIQNIRSQRKCRMSQSSLIRSCICNAREEFENRILKELLECMRKSPLAQIYSAIINMSDNEQQFPFRTFASAPQRKLTTNSGSSKESNDPTQMAASDDVSSFNSAMSITHGVVLNGQCLCACPGTTPPVLFGSAPSRQFSTDASARIPTVIGTPLHSNPASSMDMASLQQQRLQQQWEQEQKQLQQQFQRKQTQLYQQQLYQQQPVSATGLISGPARSVEAGIGDGFERFFQGMPPIRRRDVSSQQRIPKF